MHQYLAERIVSNAYSLYADVMSIGPKHKGFIAVKCQWDSKIRYKFARPVSKVCSWLPHGDHSLLKPGEKAEIYVQCKEV